MERSRIRQYDSGVHATIKYPDWTVPDLLRRSAARFPHSSGLLFSTARRCPFGDLAQL